MNIGSALSMMMILTSMTSVDADDDDDDADDDLIIKRLHKYLFSRQLGPLRLNSPNSRQEFEYLRKQFKWCERRDLKNIRHVDDMCVHALIV